MSKIRSLALTFAAALSISTANANQPETIKRDITELIGEITDNIP